MVEFKILPHGSVHENVNVAKSATCADVTAVMVWQSDRPLGFTDVAPSPGFGGVTDHVASMTWLTG